MVMTGTYDSWLVALSVMLAMVASYAALDLAGRVTAAQGWARAVWLTAGAVAMGLGIWAMHYIGMLAFHLPVPILYHVPTVALSLLAAVAASAVALFIVSRPRMGVEQELVGSVVMGCGIAGMHYIGMAAMRLPAMMEYRWDRVGLSVLLAVVISLVALILSFHIRQEQKLSLRKILSALVMGSAIPLMHYTGMWAVKFHASALPFDTRQTVHSSLLEIDVISIGSMFVLVLAIGTSFLDRLLHSQRTALGNARESETHFRALGEAIPEIVWTATPDGMTDYCNKRWYESTGLTEQQTLGRAWTQAIHPDDLPVCIEDWDAAAKSGSTLQTQYRLRYSDGRYHWHLVRSTPMRDSTGAITKWFGTSTDIEDQKHHVANSRGADQGTHRGTGRCQHPAAGRNVGKRSGPQSPRPAERAHGAGADRAFAARHHAGEDGRAAAELHQQGRSVRGRPGLCPQNLSGDSRGGGFAQRGSKSGRSDRLVGGLPDVCTDLRAQFLLGAADGASSSCSRR